MDFIDLISSFKDFLLSSIILLIILSISLSKISLSVKNSLIVESHTLIKSFLFLLFKKNY